MEQPGPLSVAAAVREAVAADLDGIEAVERAAFPGDELSRRSLRRFLAVACTWAGVAARGADILGYAMIGFRAGSSAGRLFTLAVHPSAGRQGLGSALLEACEAGARRRGAARVTLEVRSDNAAALALYGAAGYRNTGILRAYYEDGADAIRLEKLLPGA